ncbi:hypothetical protein EHS25_006422 [Saitozyma podzolica]|uniref:Ribosome maturation protein SDO1/SBDS N-terminal domain-containing protein n=1 Tax=Saitozyma podzolica TaxID=1890683 RepID=A0A427YRM1_9TREE|nr:hypothetical protein EHS25_006422 [Saitozyma podzolica]
MSVAKAVIWKPSEHADEYIVFVDDIKEYEAWKEDKSIALSRFLGQFAIFKSATSGHTGSLGEISKQEIENVFFGDEKNVKDKSVDAAIGLILQHGHVDNKDLSHCFKLNKNPARGANESRPPQSHGAGAGSGHGR